MFTLTNKKHVKVFSSSINEELGQIQYIFTDKTGTLTCNKMIFRFCTIGNNSFGETDYYQHIQQHRSLSIYDIQKGLNRRESIVYEKSAVLFEFQDH